ncbi:hypothetical protein DOTSEDRAFT_73403 [Dothistroma septosporum NZE10]|uniref:Amidase domain-containing protein n=1 Tax=Dothistroma septosporum (strain NZE10 / CBS 128990) TaxID=675120 RepID=N1PK95_DOTSN|nr:hypothetical protein DOTSEDRAFT_73403 [Dothistroma septosporum NZE10]
MAAAGLVECTLTIRHDDPVRLRDGCIEFAALYGTKQENFPDIKGGLPVTVIPTHPARPWTRHSLERYLVTLQNEDDVTRVNFRRHLVFCGHAEGHFDIPPDVRSFLRDCGVSFYVAQLRRVGTVSSRLGVGYTRSCIAAGPYLWLGRRLRPIYRLYDDSNNCIVQSLHPCHVSIGHTALGLCSSSGQALYVAAPSRSSLVTPWQPRKQLHGKRILVKDNFDIEGVKMSLCNAAFYDLSAPAQRTAPVIQRLLECGAVIVGTTKLSSMISREEPSESMDLIAPANPRGDGKQSPAGSSSGSAAAVAAYDWVDFAIGSDSTGSGRRPAVANGCFSFRVTTGTLPAEGVVPCFPSFDAPAVFTRDLRPLVDFVRVWSNGTILDKVAKPTSVIVVTDYVDALRSKQQQDIFTTFVGDISSTFNLKIRKVSLHELWADCPPQGVCGQSLEEYLHNAGRNSFFYDFYQTTKAFRKEYWRKYHCSPPVNNVTTRRWEIARDITPRQREDSKHRMGVFKLWLLRTVFQGDNPIMALPIMDVRPNYRDDPSEVGHIVQEAWDQLWVSPLLGAPEITVPIGQVAYHSIKTGREEMLPVAASMLGLPGTDLSLIANAEEVLRISKRHLRVSTGRQMWLDDWELVERTRTPRDSR